MEIDAEVLAHYAEGREHGRLTSRQSLELLRALAEARRVTRPGGIVAAAVISRYASTFDAFFHDPASIADEVTGSGLLLQALLPIEGPLHWAPGIRDRLSDPGQRQVILDTLAAMEHDPAIAAATAHLLAIGQHP